MLWNDWAFMSDSNGNGARKVNGLVIGAALAALGVGGSSIGIIGNQTDTAQTIERNKAANAIEMSEMRDEIAALRVLLTDSEKEMIALVDQTDNESAERFRRGRRELDVEIKELEDTVHKIELNMARSGR